MPSLDKMMMNVNSCCCGCSLRTGTLILLWLAVIGAALQVLESFGPTLTSTTVTMDGQGHIHEVKVKKSPVYGLLQFQFLALTGIVAAFGLYGVSNRKPSFLLPYVYLNVVEMILGCVLIVLAIFLGIFMQHTLQDITSQSNTPNDEAQLFQGAIWSLLIFLIIAGGICISLNWYFTSVVYRYYKQLESQVQQSYQGGALPRYDAQLKA